MTTRWGITVPLGGVPLAEHARVYAALADADYTDIWSSEVAGADAFTPLALAAAWEPRLRLGTAIVPAYTRSPACFAQSVASMADAAPGRFAIGIGSSSNVIVERWNGLKFEEPYKKVRDVAVDQWPDGTVANMSPSTRGEGRESPISFLNGSAGWGDAAVVVPWELYRAYGDVQVLDELWPTMVRWLDRVERMAEQVAVVEAVATAERPHELAVTGLDERVDDDGAAPAHPSGGEVEIVGARDPRMPDDLDLEVRELPLDRLDDPSGGLACRVGDDV